MAFQLMILTSNAQQSGTPRPCFDVRMIKSVPIPTKLNELDGLTEYDGLDAAPVYSDDELAVFWSDANGNKWWLVQRPDGSFCKIPMID